MSKEYFNFGVGWKYTSKDGKEYYSCRAYDKADSKWNQVKIQAVNDAGETVDVTEFVMFNNDNSGKTSKSGKPLPDVRFSFTIGEDD